MSNRRLTPENLARLEAAIRNAGDYVHPSDDLRPRTLESAREQVALQRGQRYVCAAAAAVALAAAIGFPATFFSAATRAPLGTTSMELSRIALQRVSGERLEPGAAIAEVYAELRQSQANRLTANRQSPPGG